MATPESEAWRNQQALEEIRRLAAHYLRQEAPGHTLTPTALTHEAVLRAYGGNADPEELLRSKAQAAAMMRNILVDHARRKKSAKRGGGARRVTLAHVDPARADRGLEVLELEDALEALRSLCERQHSIVVLRYYGGMTQEEIARHLDVSLSTVEKDWRMARTWLRERLEP